MSNGSASQMSLRVHHYAIVVPNLDEASRWYQEKLDFEVEREFGFPDLGTEVVHLTNGDGLRIEIFERDGSAAGPDIGQDPFGALLVQGSKHVGLLVDDVDATAEELKRRGVELVVEPTVVEPAGVKNCWIRDPAGTLIEFDQWLY